MYVVSMSKEYYFNTRSLEKFFKGNMVNKISFTNLQRRFTQLRL